MARTRITAVASCACCAARCIWGGRFFDAVGALDLGAIGYVSVGLFAAGWAASVVIWKFGPGRETVRYVHAHRHTHADGTTHSHPHRH